MKSSHTVNEEKDLRKIVILSLMIIILLTLLAQGCKEIGCVGQITTSAEQALLDTPGEIFIKDNLIFVGEVNEGIHVIDNTDPFSPTSFYWT